MTRLILSVLLFHIAVLAQGQFSDSISIQLEDGSGVSPQSALPSTKNPSTLPATREYASEKIEVRKFDQEKWREIVESRDYTETRSKNPKDQKKGQPSGPESGSRAQNDEDEGSYDYDNEKSTVNLSWLGPLGQIIFYVAIAAIIGVILFQIVRNTSFRSNPKRISPSANSTDDIHDISELDTEGLILKAHHARDYKLAIRLYFLDLLKKLNEKGTIVWTKDKTNRDYLSELFSKQYYFDEIRTLTLAYERVWYGEHIPTEEGYQELKNEFQEVSQKFNVS